MSLCTFLQPENLLLDSYGTLKVSDFGLSAFAPQIRVSVVFVSNLPKHYELLNSKWSWKYVN